MSLFDDPSFKKMKESLSKEEQEKYDKAGEHMYSYDYNFDEKGDNKTSEEVLEQLTLALRSGLHPSDLEKEEIEFLENYHPLKEMWFKDFGYLKNDLNRINF